jgi:Tol biopolymer transport system component
MPDAARPSLDFFVAGGTLRDDAPSYVRRPADEELPRLAAAGQLCYVLTTRQMGKSSLMNRTARQLRQEGIRTAVIDLTSIGTATPDEWFLSILDDLQSQLALATDAEAWWVEQSALSPVKRFTKFLHDVLLAEAGEPVVIFIDEVDSALQLPFSDDFFAAVRSAHNQTLVTGHPGRLAFVLLGVAAPNDLIKDQRRTPFNVGERIELEELALAAARPVLAQGVPGENPALIERIFYWTGGHPYLTQRIGQAMARSNRDDWSEQDVDELVAQLFLTERARTEESNLQFVNGRVSTSRHKDALLRLYRQVYRGRKKVANDERSPLQTELKLYGLVRVDEAGHLTVRNRIYRQAFNEAWLRQQAGAGSRRLLWLALTGVILFLLGSTLYFYRQAPDPDELLAQTYRSNFAGTENPVLRLDNLARLSALPDYEAEAVTLFHNLPLAAQVELFSAAPADLQRQVEAVAIAVYSSLAAVDVHERSENTQVLAAMLQALRRLERLERPTLPAEIDSWLEGRSAALQGNFAAARLAYSVALSLNPANPAVRFERALVAVALGEDDAALADLAALATYGPDWTERARQTIRRNPQLHPIISAGDSSLAALLAFVPPATPTAVPSITPASPGETAVTAAPTPPLTPEPATSPAELTPAPTLSPTPPLAVLIEAPLSGGHTTPAGTIVYTCYSGGADQICAINADGGNRRQLTFQETTDWYATLAPGGREIVFSSLRAGLFAIYRMSANGEDVQRLSPPGAGGDYSPAISPDGSKIAFTRAEGGNQNIWLMNRDGSGLTALTAVTGDAIEPVWSPDGGQIAYAWRPAGADSFTHIVMDANGGNARELRTPLAAVGPRFDWSPDGRWLAIYAGPFAARDIYLLAVEGSQLYRLTYGHDNLAPSFSPDGNWLVFTSARSGNNELYLIRLDGTGLTRLTAGETASWQPRWGR